jgi:O-antigen ligase
MPLSGPLSRARIARGGERLLGWCLGLGLLLLALAQLPSYSWQGYVVPKLVVLSVLVGLLLLLLTLALVGPRTEALTVNWYTLAGVAFVLWSAVTAVTGTNTGASFLGTVYRYEGVLGFVAYLVVFLAARHLASSRFVPGRLVLVLGAVGIGAIGLLGILQHVWPSGDAVGGLSLFGTSRSQSTFTNPIILGLFGCLVLPVLLALLSERPEGGEQPLLLVAASLIAAGAFLSYSRAFWLAAPIGCALALVLAGPPQSTRWRSAIPTAAFAALCIVVALQVGTAAEESTAGGDAGANAVSVSSRVNEALSGGGSVRSRIELYRGALTLIAERPLLGRGFETYTPEAARTRTEALVRTEGYSAYADRPHNSLLYVAYATGLPGLVLYLLFLGGALLAAVRGYRSRFGPEKVLAAGFLGGVVAYLLAEQTVFSTIEVSPLFFAMLGWAAASPEPAARGAVEAAATRPWARGITLPPSYVSVLAAFGLLATVGWMVVAVPHALDVLAADHTHYRLSSRPQDSNGFEESVRKELGAARSDPYTTYYWNTAALMLESAAEQLQRPAELEQARKVLEEGLRPLPDDPTLVVSLSNVLARSNRQSEAVALLVPYLAVDKYQADGHYNLGLIYLSWNRPQEAVPYLEAAVRFNPQDADSHWYLGEAYRALGRPADAQKEQETAASLNPEYRTGSAG